MKFQLNPMFPDATREQKWEQFRIWKSLQLQMTAWTQAEDAGISEREKKSYRYYRQFLNSAERNYSDVEGIEFPCYATLKDYQTELVWLIPELQPVSALSLSPPEQIILANGEDFAELIFRGEPGATVEYTINGQAQSLILDDTGSDSLELTCDTPSTTLLVQAGTARAVIYAVEVPA